MADTDQENDPAASDEEEADAAAAPAADGLTDYERKRLETIKQNQKVLESLGLLNGAGGLLIPRSSAVSRPREKRERVWEKREMPERRARQPPPRFNMSYLGGQPARATASSGGGTAAVASSSSLHSNAAGGSAGTAMGSLAGPPAQIGRAHV